VENSFEPESKSGRIVAAISGYRLRRPGSGDHAADLAEVEKGWKRETEILLRDRPDLIVTTEWSDSPDLYDPAATRKYLDLRGARMREYWGKVTLENRCCVVYSHLRRTDGDALLNTSELIDRSGRTVGFYNKNFVTPGECDMGVMYGEDEAVFDTDFGRVGMMVCFDLNFMDLMGRYEKKKTRLLLFSSMFHGGVLQEMWALRCQSYLLGAVSNGRVSVVNPLGVRQVAGTEYFNRCTLALNLDYEIVHLDENADRLERLKDKYRRGVTLHERGNIGRVMVTSELRDVSARDMLDEFGIRDVSAYLAAMEERRSTSGRMAP